MLFHIDAKECINKEATYSYLINQLQLPDYTGYNLDALWDVLTDLREPITIEVRDARYFVIYMKKYGLALLDLLGDVSNDTIHTVIMYW